MTLAIPASSKEKRRGGALDPVFEALCAISATTLLAALIGVIVSLLIGGWPAFHKFGFGFFVTSDWNPVTEVFGAAGPVVGTVVTSVLALAMALPVAFGVAVFLVEFCPSILRRPIGIAVELLAGIPSIVYGMWGLFVLAPWFALHIQLPLMLAAPPVEFRDYACTIVRKWYDDHPAALKLARRVPPVAKLEIYKVDGRGHEDLSRVQQR